MIELPYDFSTSIDELLKSQNKQTIFLSSWNKGVEQLDFPDRILKPAIAKFPEMKNEYLFSDELEEYKKILLNDFNSPITKGASSRFGIFSNGTVAGLIAIASVKELVPSIHALLIAPTYFTYVKILRDFDSSIWYDLAKILDDKAKLNIKKIKLGIDRNRINLIILTLPLFGTGISICKEQIKELCNVCKQYDCYLLIDYMYGGMPWEQKENRLTSWLWELSKEYPLVIVIESISKRIFLNGIKSAVAISSPYLIKRMELKSVHLAGSMSYVQLAILSHLMLKENRAFVSEQIEKNIQTFKQNYEILKAYSINTPVIISPCKEGYFCLGKLSNHSLTSMEMAKSIMSSANVLTIPHDRYLYFTPGVYTFRINLALEKEVLLSSLRRLLQINFQSID